MDDRTSRRRANEERDIEACQLDEDRIARKMLGRPLRRSSRRCATRSVRRLVGDEQRDKDDVPVFRNVTISIKKQKELGHKPTHADAQARG